MAFCKNCGKEIPDNTKFCTYCGAKVSDAPATTATPAATAPGNYNKPSYNQASRQPANNNDSSSFGWALLGFLIPLVGLILYLVWRDDTPLKANSAGKGALAAVIVYAAVVVIVWLTTVGTAGCLACSACY